MQKVYGGRVKDLIIMRRFATFAVKNYGRRISLLGYSRSFPRKNQGLWHTVGARPSTPTFLRRQTLKRAVSFSPEIPKKSSNFVFQYLFVSSIVLYTSYEVYKNEGLKRSILFGDERSRYIYTIG